jgi:hypothetical protein
MSTVTASQKFGIKDVDQSIRLVSFMPYDFGYFDLKKTLQPSTTRSARDSPI